jgi:hypothetical protein
MFIIVPIIMIIASVVAVSSPRTAWYFGEGWKYKNVEPSDGALVMIRVGGVFGVIFGIVFIILSQSMLQRWPAGFP